MEPKRYYTVAKKELYKERRDFYEKTLQKTVLANGIKRWENPFSKETFPSMDDINYSVWFKRGTLYMMKIGEYDYYQQVLVNYLANRYDIMEEGKSKNLINKGVDSVTKPRLYNVITGDQILNVIGEYLDGDTQLVVKMVDLGAVYEKYMYTDREDGDNHLTEIYNEIRVGFFLNELRFGYEKVATHHFMTIVDWFVTDTNLYPDMEARGPFQYIISEKLDTSLYAYLTSNPNMETLQATLFCIAHALEIAWYKCGYIHYDLHDQNVMLKRAPLSFNNRNYLYTRPGKEGTVYVIPSKAVHNKLVKILDFGRNRIEIPKTGAKERDLFAHVENKTHKHENVISFQKKSTAEDNWDFLQGPGDRTWDIRRILWDLAIRLPISYWEQVRQSNQYVFELLLTQMSLFIDMNRVNSYTKGSVLKLKVFGVNGAKQVLLENIIFSETRNLYHTLEREGLLPDQENPDENEATKKVIEPKILKEKQEKVARELKYTQLKEMSANITKYHDWYINVRWDLIFQGKANENATATTFLSNVFFNSFKRDAYSFNDKTDVWVGQAS